MLIAQNFTYPLPVSERNLPNTCGSDDGTTASNLSAEDWTGICLSIYLSYLCPVMGYTMCGCENTHIISPYAHHLFFSSACLMEYDGVDVFEGTYPGCQLDTMYEFIKG